jgi:hypothetical protein
MWLAGVRGITLTAMTVVPAMAVMASVYVILMALGWFGIG